MIFAVCLALAAPDPVAPSTQPVITKDTRPDLFTDEPPPTAQASSEPTAEEPSTWFWMKMLIRTLLVLGAVVGLAYLTLNKGLGRLMKLTGTSTARNITVIERLPITQKHSVVMIEVHGRRLLIGTTENAIAMLADLSDIAPPSAMTVDKGQS